jgi:tetratricopeptide (TPR) repeat protein
VLTLSSCTGTGASISVLRGNQLARSGRDALAAYSYLQARQQGKEWEDWIDYDLGTLYVSMGEVPPGIRILNRTLEGFDQLPQEPRRRDRELFFRGFFNLGVARYELGNYGEAASAFIQALRLKPDDWDAKINLEICITAMMKAASASRVQTAPAVTNEGQRPSDRESEQMLQSIHREEQPVWVSSPTQDVFEQDW